MGEVIAVASGKGGTGKTTLCACIASCMAAEGFSVLCIDLDVGLRNLDIPLGLIDSAVVSFEDVLAGRSTLADAVRSDRISGLSLLTAPVRAAFTADTFDRFSEMQDTARQTYDYVFLDAPAGISGPFDWAARTADRALIVSTADPASMRDAGCAADRFYEAGLTDCRIVVNRITGKMYRRMHITVDDVMDQVGLPLTGIVPEDPNVTLAAAAGIPLILYSHTGAAEACLHIARRLRGMKVKLLGIR